MQCGAALAGDRGKARTKQTAAGDTGGRKKNVPRRKSGTGTGVALLLLFRECTQRKLGDPLDMRK